MIQNASRIAAGFCDLTTSCPGRCAGSAGPGPVAAPTPCRADLQLREGNSAAGPFRVCLAAPATGQNCWVPNCTSGGCTLNCAGSSSCKSASSAPNDYRCVPLKANGETCTDLFDCGAAYQCVGGRCTVLSVQGAPCGDLPDGGFGAVGYCQSGLRCSSRMAGTCVPTLVAGEACPSTYGCGTGLICGMQGRCVVPTIVVRGASCNLTDRTCDTANICIQNSATTGVCSQAREAGQSCIYSFSFAACRAGLLCESSSCAGCPFLP